MNSASAVTDPAAPKVLEAHGSAGDQLDFNNVYYAQYITAQVPHYTGMARGHTVRITWENPRHTYHSAVITVGTPGTIDIRIPRPEVIDSIGHTVKILYTVRTAPGTPLIPSRYLLLRLTPQLFDLLAPTLTSDLTTLSVSYVGMKTGYTVRIRATANTVWESDERPVQTGVTPVFTLPSDWRATNRGTDALINYTVYKSGSGERLMFSKMLRTRIGEADTAPTLTSVKGTLSGREIPKGGTTAELAVTLRGIAAKGLKVEVFDHAVSQGEATADGAIGEWTFNVSGLGRVEHSFKVKALYGTRPESAPWNFTVLKSINLPTGKLLIGQSISTETCRITFLHQNQVNCYINCEYWRIFPYVPYAPGSITYQLDFIGQTTERVNLKAEGGNILGPTTITFAFLNSSGATMGTISKIINRWAEYHLIDSGRLPGIASVRITVTGQIYIASWEFGRIP